jgi:hypothetical protein
MALAEVGQKSTPSSPEEAFTLARQLLRDHFSGRLSFAYVDHAESTEREFPAIVVAPAPLAEYSNFQRELAQKVFGPVGRATKVRMSFRLLDVSDPEQSSLKGQSWFCTGNLPRSQTQQRKARCTKLLLNATRHADMAERLLSGGFGDGVFFHLFTAFENAMLAVVLLGGGEGFASHHDTVAEGIDLLEVHVPQVHVRAADLFSVVSSDARNRCLYVGRFGQSPSESREFHVDVVKSLLVELRDIVALIKQRWPS